MGNCQICEKTRHVATMFFVRSNISKLVCRGLPSIISSKSFSILTNGFRGETV